MTRVAIVGGGIAGLSLAHALLRPGSGAPLLEPVVFEAAGRPGGNLRTEHADGFTCEWGPNGFLDNAPATLALVEGLGLRSSVVVSDERARRRFIYHRGRLHEVPGHPLSFFASPLLSLPGRLRVAAEPFAASRPDGDESIHAFAARRIGPEAADVLIDAMVSGIFAGNARDLSLRACFPKMWEMETAHGSLVRAMLARRRRPGPRPSGAGGPGGRLTSFERGIAQLTERLADVLAGRLQLNAPVQAVRRTGGRWALRTPAGAVEADALVLAGSAAASAVLVEPLVPALAAALRQIPTAPLAVVCLGFDASALGHPLDGFGFLVPRGEGVRSLGALWDSSVYPGRAPQGHALVRVMLGGAHDPDVMGLDDESMVAAALADLRHILGIRVRPWFVRVFRHARGIPQYTRGHLNRLDTIERHRAQLPGLWFAGNSFRGVSINNCIADADALAEDVRAYATTLVRTGGFTAGASR